MVWFALSFLLLSQNPSAPRALEREVNAWHEKRVARLVAEEGWLSLVGLFWVERSHSMGSAPESDFRLPEGAPQHLGAFTRADNVVSFQPAEGVQVMREGKPFGGGALKSDAEGTPDVLQWGTFRWHVIRRGNRLGIRVKDTQAPARRAFSGIDRFPVRAKWQVAARFVPHPSARTLSVPTVLGTVEPMASPGTLVFTLQGKEYRLTPVTEGEDQLFIIFADETNRQETYGAGRFLYADPPRGGVVTLDFNRAYNPPCAFTPFATCPLPPKENRLATRIEAGEKRYQKR